MSLSILDLPEEILDPIIGALLPEYDPNTGVHEYPVDLLSCRLACRRFFWPASRWLCRRVRLKLCCFNQHVRLIAAPFICPEHASNTHVLHIASSPTKCGPYVDQPYPSPAKSPLFSQMRNLRILIVQLCPTLVRDILPHLLSLPMLHTVVLEGSETTVGSTDWSWIGGPFSNIKKLDFRRTSNIGPLISLSPSLEELTVRPSTELYEVLGSITIPWHTLRQLTLEAVLEFEKTCVALMESYQNLRRNHGFRASLTELVVTQNLTIADAHRLLTTFSGQPLRSLILGCVVNLDIHFMERVVTTFPKLHEFALLKISSESHVSTMKLNHYAAILGRLRELQVLHLNWIRRHDDDYLCFRAQLDRILVPFAVHCLRLSHLRFMHQADGISTKVTITRDKRGQYNNHVCETRRDRCTFATSVWRGDGYLNI